MMIVFHEMLHLEIPSVRTRSGKWNMHPREFWEAERQRSPNYDRRGTGCRMNVPLRRRPRLQCTDVVPGIMRLDAAATGVGTRAVRHRATASDPSDDPSSRRISIETRRIAIAALHQPNCKPEPEDAWQVELCLVTST